MPKRRGDIPAGRGYPPSAGHIPAGRDIPDRNGPGEYSRCQGTSPKILEPLAMARAGLREAARE
jgi:hypothetical protein